MEEDGVAVISSCSSPSTISRSAPLRTTSVSLVPCCAAHCGAAPWRERYSYTSTDGAAPRGKETALHAAIRAAQCDESPARMIWAPSPLASRAARGKDAEADSHLPQQMRVGWCARFESARALHAHALSPPVIERQVARLAPASAPRIRGDSSRQHRARRPWSLPRSGDSLRGAARRRRLFGFRAA